MNALYDPFDRVSAVQADPKIKHIDGCKHFDADSRCRPLARPATPAEQARLRPCHTCDRRLHARLGLS